MIGCGDVTEVKSGPAFQKAENSALVAVMGRNQDKVRDYAGRHNIARCFDNLEGILHHPGIDVFYIATPPSSHMQYTLLCAAAGKPVYVEKPMARNFQECQKMIDACRQANVPLYVAYYRRALPRFLKIKELVEQGAIGAVRFVKVTLHQAPHPADLDRNNLPWRVIPEIAGAGKFMDLASHTLDFLDSVFGPIVEVSGHAANQAHLYPAEDLVTASFVFQSGAQGTGVWCFTAFSAVDSTEIIGSKGKITFSTFDASPILLTTAEGTEEFSIAYPPHIQQPLIQTIIDELNGKGTCPSTGESGSRTNWVMDQVLAAWRERASG
jgi:predicted dehydrogenase